MKHKSYLFLTSLAVSALGMLLPSCEKDSPEIPDNPDTPGGIVTPPEPEIPEEGARRTVLVYAVASNNLINDWKSDSEEMLEGLANIDLDRFNWLVYVIKSSDDIKLQRAERNSLSNVEFVTVKEYDNKVLSTDPRRISEVVTTAFSEYPAQSYGMVFWAHGSSWTPEYSEHEPELSWDDVNSVVSYAYGGDQSTFNTDWTDIDELADALPDGMLDFLWFDNCYMSSIEVMYQMRDKSHWFIGYPTEIYSMGMPYDRTVPCLMQEDAAVEEAAQELFSYYSEMGLAATVCVADLTQIEAVAEECRNASVAFEPVSITGLQTYSRGRLGPYYDFGQYTRRVGENEGSLFDEKAFSQAMDKFVVFKQASDRNFSGLLIDKENYSGISTHAYGVYALDKEYYRSLDWYKRLFE